MSEIILAVTLVAFAVSVFFFIQCVMSGVTLYIQEALVSCGFFVAMVGNVALMRYLNGRLTYDPMYVFAYAGLLGTTIVSVLAFMASASHKYTLEPSESRALVGAPSIFWALIGLMFLYSLAPIEFEWFGEKKSVINSRGIIFAIFFILCLREIAGNLRVTRQKVGGVRSFAGKRTGQAVREGFSADPGLLPLTVQVFIYSFFRATPAWGVEREPNLSPIIFTETVVVLSADRKAVTLMLGCTFEIVDIHDFDEALDDTQETESGRREPAVLAAKEFLATLVYQAAARRMFSDIAFGPAAGFNDVVESAKSQLICGLRPKRVSVRFLRFENDQVQDYFQSLASGDFRNADAHTKQIEVTRLYQLLWQQDNSYTVQDAERLWEGFTKPGRGAFRLSFS